MVRKLAFLLSVVSLYALGQLFPPSYSAPGSGSVAYPISAANGGSGVASPTAHCVLTGEGASPFGTACPNTAGYLLTDNGAGVDPSMQPAQLFVDVTGPGITITPTAGATTVYLDCITTGASKCLSAGEPALANGIEDGQLVTLVCSSSFVLSNGAAFSIIVSGTAFSSITFENPGSYDIGGTTPDSSVSTCGAQLMWSNANGVWEIVSLYGGSTS